MPARSPARWCRWRTRWRARYRPPWMRSPPRDPLVIRAETFLPVVFDLMGRPGTDLADVRTVATHPHAEAQVRRYLLNKLPGRSVTLLGSTAAGAQAVAAGEYDAAVAPVISAELYGLSPLAHDIADNAGAVTRFVLLTQPQTGAGADRERSHHPGDLPAREPLRRAAADPDRVRGPRRQPDPDRVPADQGPARPVLLLDRLRGPHRRRPGGRCPRRAAPGLRRGSLPRFLSAARTAGRRRCRRVRPSGLRRGRRLGGGDSPVRRAWSTAATPAAPSYRYSPVLASIRCAATAWMSRSRSSR